MGSPGRGRIRASFLSCLALVFTTWAYADTPAILEVGKFSSAPEGDRLPDGWKPLTFPKIERHTIYKVVKDDGIAVVKAASEASASGLTREIKVNLAEYPILRWRWKVSNVLKKGDVTRKEGDDYPARIYVTFEYDAARVRFFEKAKFEAYKLIYGRYPPIAAINYIWVSKAPKGTIVPNPFTDRAKMIVVESGPTLLNQWVEEERNLYEDYQQAFAEAPPLVSGVALMTDTDNTGESAMAYYGDISFRQAN
jgi:hypothetical protein